MRRVISIVWLVFYLYGALLIGGGRGIFALNESFWICHCNDYDLELVALLAKENPELLGKIPARVIGSVSIEASDEDKSQEICSTTGKTNEREENDAHKLCKRKAPLRYNGIMLQNAFALQSPTGLKTYRPHMSFIFQCANDRWVIPNGYPIGTIRPPSIV